MEYLTPEDPKPGRFYLLPKIHKETTRGDRLCQPMVTQLKRYRHLLTTLNRWPLYRIKIYSKMHRKSTKVTIISRWPLYKGDRYDRFDCTSMVISVVFSGMVKFRKWFQKIVFFSNVLKILRCNKIYWLI
jgi:hypothetical protein